MELKPGDISLPFQNKNTNKQLAFAVCTDKINQKCYILLPPSHFNCHFCIFSFSQSNCHFRIPTPHYYFYPPIYPYLLNFTLLNYSTNYN